MCQLTFFQNDKSTSDGTGFSLASLNVVGRRLMQIDNALPRHILSSFAHYNIGHSQN